MHFKWPCQLTVKNEHLTLSRLLALGGAKTVNWKRENKRHESVSNQQEFARSDALNVTVITHTSTSHWWIKYCILCYSWGVANRSRLLENRLEKCPRRNHRKKKMPLYFLQTIILLFCLSHFTSSKLQFLKRAYLKYRTSTALHWARKVSENRYDSLFSFHSIRRIHLA